MSVVLPLSHSVLPRKLYTEIETVMKNSKSHNEHA